MRYAINYPGFSINPNKNSTLTLEGNPSTSDCKVSHDRLSALRLRTNGKLASRYLTNLGPSLE